MSKSLLIVFSHLRWEFVKQRPQHIMERLAHNYQIVFIEEPIEYTKENFGTAKKLSVNNNITVLQPHIDWRNPLQLVEVTKKYLPSNSSLPFIWFYSPSFVDVLDYLDYQAVIFDCMDELSAFRGASPELLSQEKKLMSKADVVFTGGKSLFESKLKLHDHVYCFPSSVDRAHFEQALSPSISVPNDISKLPHPIAGYYGVIDERLDLSLLAQIATDSPYISFVMIGPVVKIDPAVLPKLPNIHYLGNKQYDELPRYLSAFDVAMMPFAMNEATKFISPTKTLEFMAALKPIVSTPIYDVARDYQKEVYVAQDASRFTQALTHALYESPTQKEGREKLQEHVIERTSWDRTVEKMQEIINKVMDAKSVRPSTRPKITKKNTRDEELRYQLALS